MTARLCKLTWLAHLKKPNQPRPNPTRCAMEPICHLTRSSAQEDGPHHSIWPDCFHNIGRVPMNRIIYIVGLVVVVLFILSFFGLR